MKHDPLLQRYREANALDEARPAPALRERVLAQAHAQAAQHRPQPDQPTTAPRPAAANDSTWRLRALGSLAVLGLVGLLAMQFDRGSPEERSTALGTVTRPPIDVPAEPTPLARPAPPAQAPPMAQATPQASTVPVPSPAAQLPRQPAGGQSAVVTPSADRPAAAPNAAAPASTRAAAPEAAVPPSPAASSVTKATEDTRDQAAPSAEASARTAPPRETLPQAARNEAAADAVAAPEPSAPSGAPAGLAQARPSLRAAAPAAAAPAAPPPLLAAAAAGRVDEVRQLLRQGAHPDQRDGSGRTALLLAAARGDAPLVRLLLASGADAQLRDAQGRNAADLARAAGHAALADELLTPSSPPPPPTRPGL